MRGFIVTISILFSFCGKAQDIMYSSPQTAPLEINPTFAGNDTCATARVGYRIQFPNIHPGLHQTYVAASFFMAKPIMFAGVKYKYTYNGATDVHYTSVFFAKYMKISRKQEVRIGLDVAYFKGQMDWNLLDFSDQVDTSGNGGIYPSNEAVRGGTHGGIDFNAGISYHLSGFLLGFAAYHISQPNASVLLGFSPIPRRYTLTTGYSFNWNWINHASKFGLHVLMNRQADMGTYTVLLSTETNTKYGFNYAIEFGGVVKHGFQFSYQLKKFRIGYTFDYYTNDYIKGLGNAHEMYLVYRFLNRSRKNLLLNKGCVWN